VTAADYPDWSAPQAHANAIAVTGVPLLAVPTVVNGNLLSIAAGVTNQQGSFPLNQVAYEIVVDAIATGAGAAGPLQITVKWNDNTFGTTVATEEWYIWPGSSGVGHVVLGRGPVKANNVVIAFTNLSGAMTYQVQYAIYQRSNVYTRDDWRSQGYAFTSALNAVCTADPPSNQVAYASVSVPGATNTILELPLISGNCYFHAETTSLTTDLVLAFQNSAGSFGSGLGSTFAKVKSDASGLVTGNIAMPRFQSRVVLGNTNAAAKTVTFSLIYQDAAS
jgi:hypothetical protein